MATFEPSPSTTFIPAATPPPGVIAQHHANHEQPDNVVELLSHVIFALCAFLTTVLFILRTYVRAYVKRQFILEDYVVSVAWACFVSYCVLGRISHEFHAGEHIWNLTQPEVNKLMWWFNLMSIQYCFVVMVIKVALLCLYRRIFSSPQYRRTSAFDITILALITSIVAYYGISSIIVAFECIPRRRIWDKSVPGRCINTPWAINFRGAFNIFTNVVILLLPIHAICKLQLDRTKKFKCVMAFTLGACGPVFTILAFVARIRTVEDRDVTYKLLSLPIYCAPELAAGLLCVCLPEVTPLFKKKLRKELSNARNYGLADKEISADKEASQDQEKGKVGDIYVTSTTTTTFSPMDTPGYIELDDMYHADVTSSAQSGTPESENTRAYNETKVCNMALYA